MQEGLAHAFNFYHRQDLYPSHPAERRIYYYGVSSREKRQKATNSLMVTKIGVFDKGTNDEI